MVTALIMKLPTITLPTLILLLILILITQQIPLLTILQITTQQTQQMIKHRLTLQGILSVLVKSAPKNITSLPTSPVCNAPLPNPIVSHAI